MISLYVFEYIIYSTLRGESYEKRAVKWTVLSSHSLLLMIL